MKKTERLQAVTILKSLLQQHTPLSYLVRSETPLTKEICFGVSRHFIRLEALADCLVTKRPKEIDVWLCLLVGLYQLHYLNIPDYAVVQETVSLLDTLNKRWAKGLVNAVLRRYCREKTSLIDQLKNSTAFQFGHPQWLISQLQQDWPDHWEAILQANDQRPPMSLRVNQRQISTTAYLTQLHKASLSGQVLPNVSTGIMLDEPCSVHDLPGFKDGAISVQDGAAQLATSLLDLKPGLRVLDACCAPGGKTCHILETETALEACIGLDIDQERLVRVQENLTRLQLHATLKQGDASETSWWDGLLFDRILLDAPCSATGVIRRHPDIKLLRTPEDIQAITRIQREVLNTLWTLLKPGGRMVYATCSIMATENERQIAEFVKQHTDCHCDLTPKSWGHETGHGWQILPGEDHMDGFFYSVLIKR